MFEHFGLKDIWPTIKRNRLTIIIFTLIFTLIFGFAAIKKIKSFLGTAHNDNGPVYVTSASYYVQPEISSGSLKSMDSDFLKSMPDNYVSFMNTDVCADFIYKKIMSSYTAEYLIKNSEILPKESGLDPKVVGIESIKKLYKVSRGKGTMVINIYALSYGEELSGFILKSCCEFIEKHADVQIKNSHIEFVGKTTKIVKSYSEFSVGEDEPLKSENIDSSTKTVVLIVVKNFMVPAVGLTALLIFIILINSVFHPTLNRKSDFCEYDVPVIGEIKT